VIVLALDTATPDTVVGLAVPGHPVAERRHRPEPGERPGHAAQLLPLARELLDAAGLAFADVDRIGVGVGPGTFTGLRIGVATARALAQGTGAALAAVSTLEALALGALDADGPVLACLDARRGEAFAAAWSGPGRLLLAARAAAPAGLPALLETHPGPWRSVGDGSVRFRDVLEGAGAQVPEDGSELHRVGALALCRLAEAAPEAGPDLRPDYVREPDAVPKPIRRPES
jgi:tRNA threonylcarbamoyladenosine biosynthesis protein TsaB